MKEFIQWSRSTNLNKSHHINSRFTSFQSILLRITSETHVQIIRIVFYCAVIFILADGRDKDQFSLHAESPTVTPLSLEPYSFEDLRYEEDLQDSPHELPALLNDGFFAHVTDPDWQWTILPKGFLYTTYWASSAEPRLSTQLFESTGEDNIYLDSYIAGRLGIVRFGKQYEEEGFQLDVLAGAKLRQDLDHEIDMVGTDYRFDIPLTYRRGPQAWKLGFYHISSHAGDEFLLRNPGFPRLNYYRDALYLGYSYYITPEFRIYAELDYAFSTEDSEPWHIQFGFDYGPTTPTGVQGAPFFAINGHLREELNFGGNINVQGGWAWRGEGLGAGILRTGPFYYNGGSPQFSFYQQSEQQLGWGLWYDF